MLGFLKKLFGGTSVDFKELVKNGAQIIDVRTPAEYNGGHIKGSKNIPLQSLNQNLGKINKNKPVITCCASGARSAAAKSILLNSGFSEVYNGGGWSGLKSKLSENESLFQRLEFQKNYLFNRRNLGNNTICNG